MNKQMSQPSQEQIRQTLQQHLPELTERYGVSSLGLFGSYARNEQNPDSDVDLLVEIDNPNLTLFEFVELRRYLSELLGIEVDLVEKATLKPAIGARILQEVEAL